MGNGTFNLSKKRKQASFNLAEKKMQKQAAVHALSYALATKGLYLSAPKVAAIFNLRKLASWNDFNQMDMYQRALVEQGIKILFKKQFGSNVDPMHINFSKFNRPSLNDLAISFAEVNRTNGLNFSSQEINKLASYVFNDWNTIIVPPVGEIDSVLNIMEPEESSEK